MAQRFEGKNLEEALDAAAAGFGVQRYQLTYHVVLEKRGFLGGMKRVIVEAEINDSAAEPEPPSRPTSSFSDARSDARGNREQRPRGGRGRGSRNRERGSERGGGRRRERAGSDELQPGDFAQFAEEIPEQAVESEGAAAVRSWCEKLLSLARFDAQVRSEENEKQIILRLYGRDTRLMVERHGELLDALQVLANKALVARNIEKDIELDCQQFKGRRAEELEQKARRLADQVRRDGREQLLPAMTPIERRIVHLALADDAAVTTQSRGEGFYKRIAIVRRDTADQQPSQTAP